MMISVGGFSYRLDFESDPTPGEFAFLERFHPVEAGKPDFTVRIENEPTSPSLLCAEDIARVEESQLAWRGDDLLISHPLFHARIDASEKALLLRRDPAGGAIGLAHLLRASLSVLLPSFGCLPIHACGVVIGGNALAFFGRSGAGKTTLAATSPYPVLSDEIVVAVQGIDDRWRVRQSGVWGGIGPGTIDTAEYPLSAVVELAKGDAFALEPISPGRFTRSLVGMILVPPNHRLWTQTLELVESLSLNVSALRLTWALDDPPWNRLTAVAGSARR